MALFSKLNGPEFIKDDSEAKKTLAKLKELKDSGNYEGCEALDKDIINVSAGIAGEKQIRLSLRTVT